MPKKTKYEDLPYRPCAGLCVHQPQRAWCSSAAAPTAPSTPTRRTSGRCRRAASTMARSPIRPRCASFTRRPTSSRSRSSARSAEWLAYDIPKKIGSKAWNGKYRGQKQKWYALRFTGNDSEIDIENPAGGHDPEFIEWRWEPMENLPDLVVPFKRKTYERVVKAFSAKSSRNVSTRPAQRKHRAQKACITGTAPSISARLVASIRSIRSDKVSSVHRGACRC